MALTDIDRLLLGRCLEQTPGSWRDFVDRFAGLFCHVVRHTADARSVTLDEADVEDLVADVMAEIVKDDFAVLRRFRMKSSLATYLAVVARRVVVRNLIAKRRLELGQSAVQSNAATNNRSSGANGHEELRLIEDADEIEQLLQRLPEREAEMLRQYHLEGRSYRELSEHFNLSENSVGAALSRARETLSELTAH